MRVKFKYRYIYYMATRYVPIDIEYGGTARSICPDGPKITLIIAVHRR